MAIKIKGKEVNLFHLKKQQSVNEIETQFKSTNKKLIDKKIIENSYDSPLLIVNGKVKKISKESRYLIDMLIIEEE